MEIYTNFKETKHSKIFATNDFGFRKVTVEQPLFDEKTGLPLFDCKGRPKPNKKLTETEIIPLNEDIIEYMNREVLPFAPSAYINEEMTKTGYEIPFTKYFYEYKPPRKTKDIMAEILELYSKLDTVLKELANE